MIKEEKAKLKEEKKLKGLETPHIVPDMDIHSDTPSYGNNSDMRKVDELSSQEVGVFCKFCNRNHKNTFDSPGINHDRFDVGGKAESMFNNLCSQDKVRIFIPYEQGEKLGAIASPQINGLRVNILKGRYVEVPEQIAELMMNSLNQTAAIPNEVMTKNPYTGKVVNAKIELRDEATKSRLDA